NTHRPNSFSFSQSTNNRTKFEYTPAFLYNKKGYETSFIYGGDLSWRDIGSFVKAQDYDNVEGKINIYNTVKKENDDNIDYFHPWGIYDEFLFEHVEQKLLTSETPQFIFALTTNNHPPYNVPRQYSEKELTFSDELKKYLNGDMKLIEQRMYSYQYAIDQVGLFLNKIKNSKLKDNTIVVVTADNNTLDGIMSYPNNKIFNSKNIPCLFFIPNEIKKKIPYLDTTIYASHKDIFPTLYNLTLNNTSYYAIGNDLFTKNSQFTGFNGSQIVVAKEGVYTNVDQNNEIFEYYKATLVVQEYLLKKYMK
ncbi:MAG: sulfatase-like hydrolase/transferase, partial [Arcobacteraceae bacterium]